MPGQRSHPRIGSSRQVAAASGVLPITHSVFAARGLATTLLPNDDLGDLVECALIQHNQIDTYLARTRDARYVPPVYQARGIYAPRTPAAIEEHIDLLLHVALDELFAVWRDRKARQSARW